MVSRIGEAKDIEQNLSPPKTRFSQLPSMQHNSEYIFGNLHICLIIISYLL